MTFRIRTLQDDGPSRAQKWGARLLLVLGVAKPLFSGVWAMYKNHKENEEKKARRHFLKRVGLFTLAGLCGLVLIGGVARALVDLQVVSLKTITGIAASPLPVDSYGHTNILLLGQGDETHDGVDLTDTMMIASLDPVTSKSIVMLSIPRDLYVLDSEKMGKGRINSLYRDYKHYLIHTEGKTEEEASALAVRELANEIGKAFGMNIHHVIKVDFVGFVKAVDAIGGVQIDVPEDIVDTEYPGPNYSYQTFSLMAGQRLLDGETALKYARSRHSTSDFDRSARQQQILKAIGDKVKKEGLFSSPARLNSLLNIMEDHVHTTMDLRELLGLVNMGMELDHDRIITLQINNANGLYGSGVLPGGFLYNPPREQFGGASVLLPVSLPEFPVTWKQLQTLTQLLIHTRVPYVANPTINVLNAGAVTGSSRLLAGELIRYGFSVDKIENSGLEKMDDSFVAAGGEADVENARFFATLLKLPLRPVPVELAPGMAGRVTIILGKNYGYTPLQDLLPTP